MTEASHQTFGSMTGRMRQSEYESVRADAELFATAKGHATHGASA